MTDEASGSLDRRALVDRVEGDLELLVLIVETFLSRLPEQLEEIDAAVRSRDAHTLATSSHALKGSVANFSLGPVYQLSSRLERIGKSAGSSPGEAGGATDAPWAETERLADSLRAAAGTLETELRAVADDARSGFALEDM